MDSSIEDTLCLIALLAEQAIIYRRRNQPKKVLEILSRIEFEASSERHHIGDMQSPMPSPINDSDIPW